MGSLLFKAAFHDSSIPQVITDLEGTFIEVNDAFCKYLGRDSEELIGMNFREFNPEDDDTPGLDLREELKTSQHWCTKKKYVRKDGTLVRAVLSVSGIYEDDELKHVLAQIQDQSTSSVYWTS